jgi:pectate lyase
VFTHNPSVFNNFYDHVGDAINTRDGAQVLVENNVFSSVKKGMFSTDGGYAVERGDDFGGCVDTAPNGTLKSAPYNYSLSSLDSVRSGVPSGAGANLYF